MSECSMVILCMRDGCIVGVLFLNGPGLLAGVEFPFLMDACKMVLCPSISGMDNSQVEMKKWHGQIKCPSISGMDNSSGNEDSGMDKSSVPASVAWTTHVKTSCKLKGADCVIKGWNNAAFLCSVIRSSMDGMKGNQGPLSPASIGSPGPALLYPMAHGQLDEHVHATDVHAGVNNDTIFIKAVKPERKWTENAFRTEHKACGLAQTIRQRTFVARLLFYTVVGVDTLRIGCQRY
eukprot:592981-Pelagomonas_calceolata.AAC.7